MLLLTFVLLQYHPLRVAAPTACKPFKVSVSYLTEFTSFKSDGIGSNIVPSLMSGFVVRFGVVLLPARFEKLLPVTYL